jgi:hypothetical protein
MRSVLMMVTNILGKQSLQMAFIQRNNVVQQVSSSKMTKTVEKWLLYKYVGLEFTPLSKPFKTREQAEKAREKYPERLRKRIGLGVVRRQK